MNSERKRNEEVKERQIGDERGERHEDNRTGLKPEQARVIITDFASNALRKLPINALNCVLSTSSMVYDLFNGHLFDASQVAHR